MQLTLSSLLGPGTPPPSPPAPPGETTGGAAFAYLLAQTLPATPLPPVAPPARQPVAGGGKDLPEPSAEAGDHPEDEVVADQAAMPMPKCDVLLPFVRTAPQPLITEKPDGVPIAAKMKPIASTMPQPIAVDNAAIRPLKPMASPQPEPVEVEAAASLPQPIASNNPEPLDGGVRAVPVPLPVPVASTMPQPVAIDDAAVRSLEPIVSTKPESVGREATAALPAPIVPNNSQPLDGAMPAVPASQPASVASNMPQPLDGGMPAAPAPQLAPVASNMPQIAERKDRGRSAIVRAPTVSPPVLAAPAAPLPITSSLPEPAPLQVPPLASPPQPIADRGTATSEAKVDRLASATVPLPAPVLPSAELLPADIALPKPLQARADVERPPVASRDAMATALAASSPIVPAPSPAGPAKIEITVAAEAPSAPAPVQQAAPRPVASARRVQPDVTQDVTTSVATLPIDLAVPVRFRAAVPAAAMDTATPAPTPTPIPTPVVPADALLKTQSAVDAISTPPAPSVVQGTPPLVRAPEATLPLPHDRAVRPEEKAEDADAALTTADAPAPHEFASVAVPAPAVGTGSDAQPREQGASLHREAAWAERMMGRIEEALEVSDATDRRIRITPDALGTVDVHVRREGDAVQVQLTAEHAATRAMLAEAAPRLNEWAGGRPLQFAGGQADGGSGQRPTPQPQPGNPAPRAAGTADTLTTTDHRIA